MGEVKSTLELAMERANKIEVSPEEIKEFKREGYILKAKGMANRYLDRSLNIRVLMKELGGYNGTSRDVIVETLFSELIDAISTSLDNTRLLEAIGALKEGSVETTSDRIDKLCLSLNEEKKNRKEKVEKEIIEHFHQMGISGTAVQPQVDSEERWQQALAGLTSEYEAKLTKLKGELLEMGGI